MAATFWKTPIRASPPSRGAWIEIGLQLPSGVDLESPPSRGAWIKMMVAWIIYGVPSVAPLAGGVD